ncbi:stage II sporulation protein M [Acetobacterium sp.]|jgi:stage II sporulation protein M|uniref:stage II sporulation protein M n=1 Tax=Acetobacterium sp. TaxID=1872094 RepID=UPI00271DC9E1|nr:stage II sporulation protein M [Acetobacterium sp.]MDO9491492.1 stage II sporulation protein M [Acetobacterium sp.]
MKTFFMTQWNGAESYFEKKLKSTYYFCLAFFGIMIVLNTLLFLNDPTLSQSYFMELQALFNQKGFLNSTGIDLWLGIFLNNVIASGISSLLGVIPFLFLPLFSLASNAIIIGLIGAVYQTNGIGWFAFLVGVLPHGMIEIPALVLGVTLGVHLCFKLSKTILRRSFKGELKQAVIGCLRIYLLWLIPLFFLAAFIETFMTPILFNAVAPL